jgi:hypothetical protein
MSETATETKTEEYVIPKQCKAGVVVNEGPDFRVVLFPSQHMLPATDIDRTGSPRRGRPRSWSRRCTD